MLEKSTQNSKENVNLEVVAWWEGLRVPYNIFMCILFTLILFSSEYIPTKSAWILFLISFVILNFCYTFSWIFELYLKYYGRLKNKGLLDFIRICMIIIGIAMGILFLLLFPKIIDIYIY